MNKFLYIILFLAIIFPLKAQVPAYACQTDAGFLTFDNQGKLLYNPMETGIQKPLKVIGNKMLVLRVLEGEYKAVITNFLGKTIVKPDQKNNEKYRIMDFSADDPFIGLAYFEESEAHVFFDKQGKTIFNTKFTNVKILGKGYFAYAQESPEAVSEPNLHWTIQHLNGSTFKLDAYVIHPFDKAGLIAYEKAGKVEFLKLSNGNFSKVDVDDVISANFPLESSYISTNYPWTIVTKAEGETMVQLIIDSTGKVLPHVFMFAQNNKFGISGVTFDKKGVFLDKNLRAISVNIPPTEYQDIGDFQVNNVGLVFFITSEKNYVFAQLGKKSIKIDTQKPYFYLSEKLLFVSDDFGLTQINSEGVKKFLGKFTIQSKTDDGFVIQNMETKGLGWMNNMGVISIPTLYDLIEPHPHCILARIKKEQVIWDVFNYEGKKIASDVFKTHQAFYIKTLDMLD